MAERLDGYEAPEEVLSRSQRLDPTGRAEAVTGRDVAALDGLRGLASRPVQPCPDMRGLRKHLLDRLDVGLVAGRACGQ